MTMQQKLEGLLSQMKSCELAILLLCSLLADLSAKCSVYFTALLTILFLLFVFSAFARL